MTHYRTSNGDVWERRETRDGVVLVAGRSDVSRCVHQLDQRNAGSGMSGLAIVVELYKRNGRGFARERFSNANEAMAWISAMRALPSWRDCRAHIDARPEGVKNED